MFTCWAIFTRFQDACPDHVQVEGSGSSRPRELAGFVALGRPRE